MGSHKKKLNENRIKNWMKIAFFLMVYDFIVINFAYFFGLWIRFDFSFVGIPKEYLYAFGKFTPIYAIITILFFWMVKLYRSVWRFVGVNELLRYMIASLMASIVHSVAITLIFQRMPFSYHVVGAILQLILVTGIRFTYRVYLTLMKNRALTVVNAKLKNVMIIGAGAAGREVIRELLSTEEVDAFPVCIIDDNKNKWDRFIDGIPIVGGREDIVYQAKKYKVDEIYFCIPSATPKQKKEILDICKETGCELKSLPGVFQLITGEVLTSRLRPVAVEDLLGREPVKVNMDEIYESLQGKRILVTGGGGSIGSELCRQIANHQPEHLIIFDIYENNAYEIQQELKRHLPDLNLTVLIGSVRDPKKMDQVFATYKPQIVYHAAAHKHVPLMETSPCEAIKNNVFGTYITSLAAMKHGAEKFVLISTDKAVNPANVMGASKRICEMIVQSMNQICREKKYQLLDILDAYQELIPRYKDCHTDFAAVRFGNVLGSNGSVIPLFKKQIEEGGPVTVTHPDIIRYFMTIPEAVNLVLQAGTYATGGEIFILDMGEPVKIDTLARNLIKLSGLTPDEDIEVKYIGLRPGDKLFEEKLMAEEGMMTTPNRLIHIGKPTLIEIDEFLNHLVELFNMIDLNSDEISIVVGNIVTNYQKYK